MCFNEEYTDLYSRFVKMTKICRQGKYSRNLLQILFLRFYSIKVIIREIRMILREESNIFLNDILNEIYLIIKRKSLPDTPVIKPNSIVPLSPS